MAESEDLYAALGVDRDASPEAIKAAGRAAAREHHPDLGGDPEKMKLVSRALTILRDPEKRKRYDETGEADARAKPADPVTPQVLRAFEVALSALATEDPRFFDLPASMKRFLLGEAAKGEEANEAIKGTLATLKAVQKRLRFKGEGEGPIARVLADRIRLNETNLANNSEVIGHMRAAAAFVDEWLEYETDPKPPVDFRWSDRAAVDIAELMLRSGAARFTSEGLMGGRPRPRPFLPSEEPEDR
jgi:hypothetical protein